MPYANNKGADQPAHPRCLISAFVVCCLDSIILFSFYIRNFKPLPSFCGSAGCFVSCLVANPKDRFSRHVRHIYFTDRHKTKHSNFIHAICCKMHIITINQNCTMLLASKLNITYHCKHVSWNEPRHDKTNKMACAPSEDSDQPGHPPSLIWVFAVRMKKAWALSYLLSTQQRPWSDWADAQANLSLCWVHSHFYWFLSWIGSNVYL